MFALNRTARNDAGFTIIELLITIVILSVVTFPLGNLVIDYFRTQNTATSMLGESHDAQITNAYWQQDAASIGVRASAFDSANNTFALQQSVGISFGCSVPAGTTTFAVLGWTQYDTSGNPTQVTVAYATQGSSAPLVLVRLYCSGSTLVSTTTLAHELSAQPAAPTCTLNGASSSCTGSGASVPDTVTITLSIRAPSQTYTAYAVSLTGHRRTTT